MPKVEKTHVGNRLKVARAEADLYQSDIAEEVGVQQTSVSSWEREGWVPTKRLKAVAEVLDVSPKWLATGKEPDEEEAEQAKERWVGSKEELVDWIREVRDDERYSKAVRETIIDLNFFIDEGGTWAVSVTPEALAERVRGDLDEVKSHWDEVLDSPYVERIGPGKWTLKLVFPEEEEAA